MNIAASTVIVVMPVWNGENYLLDAVDSVLGQEGCLFDFLVVDDGSEDHTLELLKAIRDPRLLIHARPHEGLCATMNHAIQFAAEHGYTYLIRMDADDISMPGRFAALVDCMESTGAIAAGSNCRYVGERGKVVGNSTVASSPAWIKWEIYRGLRGVIQGAAIFKVEALAAIGGYRNAFVVAEDTDLFLRLGECGNFTNIKSYHYHIRKTQGSRSRNDFLRNILYSNYAVDCAHRRRSGKAERSYEEYTSGPWYRLTASRVEYLALNLWNWSQESKWKRGMLPLAALLSPSRLVSRLVRPFL